MTQVQVHLVSAGTYSDYAIVAAYSTKDAAERAQVLVDPHNKVKSFDLDPPLPDWLPTGHNIFRVWMPAGGDLGSCLNAYRIGLDDVLEDAIARSSFSIVKEGSSPYSPRLYVTVTARDQEHAIKIASELFTQHLARKAGIA